MKKIFLFISILFLLSSCLGEISDSNTPHIVYIDVYKNGEKMFKLEDEFRDNVLAKTLKIKIVPEIGTSFEVNHLSTSIFSALQLPLMLNEGYVCNEPNCRKYFNNTAPEIFRMIVTNHNQELFNKKLKVEYIQIGKPFISVAQVYVLNDSNEWEKYQSTKIPIVDADGNSTDYQIEIPIRR